MLTKNVVFMDIPRPEAHLTEAFQKIGVATIHEAMGGTGLMAPAIRPLVSGQKLAGPAVTSLNHPGDNVAMHKSIQVAKAGDVLVTSGQGYAKGAIWGELTTLSSMQKGIAGTIADGAARDTALIRKLKFPVWSSSVCAGSTAKENLVCVNLPVECGGIIVNPGDLIVADDDGVVVIPYEDLEDVLAKAKTRDEKEVKIREEIASGRLLYDLMGFDQKLKEKGMTEIEGTYRDYVGSR